MKEMEKKKYPIGSEHYELLEEVGQGVSASVHRARCVPLNEIVAIKILDFERDNCDLNNISREVQTMVLVDHPNVLKSHCSFVSDHNLWVVMPYMAGGSCLHILKAAYPDGFEEIVIATILREVLKGLQYLHHHGHIHRDVKAGNILIDTRGAVKLGDFGVSACLFDSGDRQRTRNTFVGTPCWMAPEVMEQLHGYDFKADIWSFGITALELAHGHAPFSKYPPMKVLLMTLQNAPPCLDYERDKKFTQSFRQMIASCLQKDPSKRPAAKKLLDHPFFKKGRSNDYIARTLLEGLPDLGERMKALKRKEEDMLAQKKIPDGQMEELSQNEYKRGISSWNFNLDDLKAQASMIQDFDDPIFDDNPGGSSNSLFALDLQDKQSPTPSRNASQIADMEDNVEMQNQSNSVLSLDSTVNDSKVRSEKSDDYSSITSSIHELHFSQNSSPCLDDHVEHSLGEKTDLQNVGRPVEFTAIPSFHKRGLSSSVLPEMTVLPIKGESQPQNISNGNATTFPLTGDDGLLSGLPSKASKSSANSDDTDEKTKVPVVQQRGRFKVTSENVDLEKVGPSPVLQKSHSMQVITPHIAAQLPPALPSQSSSDAKSSNISLYSLYPMLQAALQMNIQQREIILNLMKQIAIHESTADGACTPANIAAVDKSVIESAHDKDKEIIQDINELQGRLICTQDEQQRTKPENGQV